MEPPEADDAVEGEQAEQDHHRLQQDEPGLRQHRSVCEGTMSFFGGNFQIQITPGKRGHIFGGKFKSRCKLTKEKQHPGERARPLGYPELAEYEVDGGRDEGAAEGGQEAEGEDGHVVAVLHADLLELELKSE